MNYANINAQVHFSCKKFRKIVCLSSIILFIYPWKFAFMNKCKLLINRKMLIIKNVNKYKLMHLLINASLNININYLWKCTLFYIVSHFCFKICYIKAQKRHRVNFDNECDTNMKTCIIEVKYFCFNIQY